MIDGLFLDRELVRTLHARAMSGLPSAGMRLLARTSYGLRFTLYFAQRKPTCSELVSGGVPRRALGR